MKFIESYFQIPLQQPFFTPFELSVFFLPIFIQIRSHDQRSTRVCLFLHVLRCTEATVTRGSASVKRTKAQVVKCGVYPIALQRSNIGASAACARATKRIVSCDHKLVTSTIGLRVYGFIVIVTGVWLIHS